LIVILSIALAVFTFAKALAADLFTTPAEFERRRNLWISITIAAFVVHNIWIFLLFVALILHVTAKKDENKVGLVLFILLTIPLFGAEIPGVGGIRYLFEINYFRLIAIVLLLPMLLQHAAKTSWSQFADETPDKLLYSYLLLNITLILMAGTLTGTIRTSIMFVLDIVLPYAVASRLTGNSLAMRSALASYVIGACVMAGIGVVEFGKNWLLYSTLDNALGLNWAYGAYLKRDESLRAMATGGQAIPFGYAMAVGFCMMLGLRRFIKKRSLWLCGIVLLGLGMIASYSRGPWVGALAGLLVFLLTGPKAGPNFARLCAIALIAAPAVAFSPLGDKLFETVTVESGSFDYRQRVFEVSIGVILNSPFFGAWDYLYAPAMEELRQGQGIIDIVNSYIAVGLRSGVIGFSLYTGFFMLILVRLWRKIKSPDAQKDENLIDIGRALLAALVCTLVTIATVSSITVIPIIYYFLAGLSLSFIRRKNTTPGDTVSETKNSSLIKSRAGRTTFAHR